MPELINIYCDESCHLENDGIEIMVLGAVWCPRALARNYFEKIRNIKQGHNLNIHFEIKWAKLSPAKWDFYSDLIRLFFQEPNLHFRALIAQHKDHLCHEKFNQDHDTWYYKMYFHMLKTIFDPKSLYKIFLDIKDTRSGPKIKRLNNILCNNIYDFSHKIIQDVQAAPSHEIELMQLTDLIIGALGYANRGLQTSVAKLKLIELIKKLSGYSLRASTLLREEKFNLFFWSPDFEEIQ